MESSDEIFNYISAKLAVYLKADEHEHLLIMLRHYGDACYSEGVVSGLPD